MEGTVPSVLTYRLIPDGLFVAMTRSSYTQGIR
jgi:hypothetical protein